MYETGYILPAWGRDRLAQGYRGGELWGTVLGRPMTANGKWGENEPLRRIPMNEERRAGQNRKNRPAVNSHWVMLFRIGTAW